MDAYSTDAANLTYSDLLPVLIAATSDAAVARAERAVEASGLRIGAKLPLELASERIGRQGKATAVWLEIDADCGGPMDELLDLVATDVRKGRYAAVVSVTREVLDPVVARIDEPAIELIAAADDSERVAALATLIGLHHAPNRISDIASDRSAERLRQLSDEVSRIAATLAPWCSSTWSSLFTRLWRVSDGSPTPRALVDRTDGLWWGNEDFGLARLSPNDLLVQYTDASMDSGVHNRKHIHHYRVGADGKVRTSRSLCTSSHGFCR